MKQPRKGILEAMKGLKEPPIHFAVLNNAIPNLILEDGGSEKKVRAKSFPKHLGIQG